MPEDALQDEERRSLLRDGFVILRGAVPAALCERAAQRIRGVLPEQERRLLAPAALATHEDVLALFNETRVAKVLRRELGPFPPVISSQVAVTPAFDELGGAPFPHVDGSWSGAIPAGAEDIEFPRGRPKDAARYFGANEDRRGSNDGQLWLDPARTISIGSYTALVGVALNDQREPGNGQFGVLKGMHEEVQAAFARQRAAGSVIGPEGLDWPRIKISESGRPYLNGLPDAVRSKAMRAANAAQKPLAGWPWPWLTPVLLGQGDAVIALHSCPHTATPNFGANPRMNVYFRIRRWREGNPHEGTRRIGHGVSDHPDRGYYGQFLEYPASYDPWTTSVDALCDHWREWDGLRHLALRGTDRKPHMRMTARRQLR